MNTNTRLIMIVIAFLAISACSSVPKATTTQTPPQEATTSNARGISTAPLHATDASSDDLAEQLQEMQKRSVYFDLNEFTIKHEFHEPIQRQADLMKAHKNTFVTLEGNADERGSSEYNLALGDRRANAVRKSLVMMGIPASRIKTVSLGEERPRLTCHEEQCWKENRRVDFMGKQD